MGAFPKAAPLSAVETIQAAIVEIYGERVPLLWRPGQDVNVPELYAGKRLAKAYREGWLAGHENVDSAGCGAYGVPVLRDAWLAGHDDYHAHFQAVRRAHGGAIRA